MQDLLDLNIEEGRMLDVDAAWGVIDFHAQRTQDRGHREMAGDDVNGVEIGEKRFISEKIISVHVSRILTKLGVSGRTEVAAVARRLGLVAPAPSSDGLGRPSA